MKLLTSLTMALAAVSLLACGSNEDARLQRLATQALSANPAIASGARAALRQQGQRGVNVLLAACRDVLESDAPRGRITPRLVREALDEVGQQRDCHASGLYWHTDLQAAKTVAAQSGKPILSLSLLGKLNEELSCANSRFFRTTLYANAEISKYLRDHFVLHWQSVRPAPRITIDFGDGRKVERTITGNSIHYVLDPAGNLLEALPGLYGPRTFMAALTRANDLARRFTDLPASERETLLRQFHKERFDTVTALWARDLEDAGIPVQVTDMATPTVWSQLRLATTDTVWSRIAAARSADAVLDAASRTLIAQKNPNAWQAGRLAVSKAVVEDPMLRLWRGLQRSIAEDTVRNEYVLHGLIHQWFSEGQHPRDLERFNAKVYAELFLTPNNDPWLGLTEGYAALENNGIVTAARK
jgi:hypothetical protein